MTSCGIPSFDDPFMTACQVITWIAFGVALRKEELGSLGLETVATGEKDKDSQYKLRETNAEVPGDITDLDQAEEQLRAAVAAGHLVAYGNRAGSGPSRTAEQIPFNLFMSRGDRVGEHVLISRQMMFTWWDTVESEAAPAAYSAVQFKASDVIAIWPLKRDASRMPRPLTGAPGRPTSMHLIKSEFERRAMAGRLLEKLRAESVALRGWFVAQHQDAPPPSVKTIENNIRGEYKRFKVNSPEIIDGH